MKSRTAVLAVLVTLCAAWPGFAAEDAKAGAAAAGHEEKIANIRKLVHIMSGKQLKDAMDKMLESSRRAIQDQVGAQVGPDEKQAFDDYMGSLSLSEKDLEEMLDLMVPFYDKYLDDEDVAALVRFYESPAGRKYVSVLPDMMNEMMPRIMERQMEKVKGAMERFQKRLEEIREKKSTEPPAAGPTSG